jgi:hypothetical protein
MPERFRQFRINIGGDVFAHLRAHANCSYRTTIPLSLAELIVGVLI